jgi:hypothetical protein
MDGESMIAGTEKMLELAAPAQPVHEFSPVISVMMPTT